MRHLLFIAFAGVLLSGCSGTIPVGYETQSYVMIEDGRASMGDFSYQPADSGDVECVDAPGFDPRVPSHHCASASGHSADRRATCLIYNSYAGFTLVPIHTQKEPHW